jgi:hypothetical protein
MRRNSWNQPSPGLAGGFQFLQVEHFVLQVEVQFAGEKALQVFVDEKVAGVAAGVLAQVVFQGGRDVRVPRSSAVRR